MKTRLVSFLFVIVTISSPVFLFAQKDADIITSPYTNTAFSNPEPTGFQPPVISATEGQEEVLAKKNQSGFEKVFFSATTIRSILGNNNCVGVRFYNGVKDDHVTKTVIAIGVKSDGTDIYSSVGPKYCISNGAWSGSQPDVDQINKTKAQTAFNDLTTYGGHQKYSTYFSKTELEETLNRTNCIGLNLMPGSRKFQEVSSQVNTYLTMLVGGAGASGTDLKGAGGSTNGYKKSLEPCPYVCFGSNNLGQ